jgi:hypothetical protein
MQSSTAPNDFGDRRLPAGIHNDPIAIKAVAVDDQNTQHLIIGLNRDNINSLQPFALAAPSKPSLVAVGSGDIN